MSPEVKPNTKLALYSVPSPCCDVLVSSETSDAAGNPYRLSEPRTVSLKGISEPLEVVAVEWR